MEFYTGQSLPVHQKLFADYSYFPFIDTVWSTNIASEHGPVEIVGLPGENRDFPSFGNSLPQGMNSNSNYSGFFILNRHLSSRPRSVMNLYELAALRRRKKISPELQQQSITIQQSSMWLSNSWLRNAPHFIENMNTPSSLI